MQLGEKAISPPPLHSRRRWLSAAVTGCLVAVLCGACRQYSETPLLKGLLYFLLPIYEYAKIFFVFVLCVWSLAYGFIFFDGRERKPRVLAETGWFGESGFGAYWLAETRSRLLFEDRDAIESLFAIRAQKARSEKLGTSRQISAASPASGSGFNDPSANEPRSPSQSPGSASTTDSSCPRLTKHVLPPQGTQRFREYCLHSGKQVIFSIHPHGIASITHAYVASCSLGLGELWHPLTLRGLAATALFRIPVIRDIWLKQNFVDAGRATALRCIQEGFSLTVSPGGEREMMLAEPGREIIVLKDRKGFARLAVQHNLPVIPVYGFGENNAFENPKLLWNLRSWIQKRSGVAFTFAYSWRSYRVFGKQIQVPVFWKNYLGRRMTVVVGKPVLPRQLARSLGIEASLQSKSENFSAGEASCPTAAAERAPDFPTSEPPKGSASPATSNGSGANGPPEWHEIPAAEVDELHGRYVSALRNLFDQFKAQCGCPNAVLEVV